MAPKDTIVETHRTTTGRWAGTNKRTPAPMSGKTISRNRTYLSNVSIQPGRYSRTTPEIRRRLCV